jgi:hypothetical protein
LATTTTTATGAWKTLGTLGLAVCIAASVNRSARAEVGDDQPEATSGKSITVTVYPLLVRAPIMGASIDLPSMPAIPSNPGAGGGGGTVGEVSGSTDVSLNSAWMAGAVIQADRWFAEMFGLYAALSASRSTPRVTVDSNTYFFNGRGGVRLVDGLSATAGFRRISVNLDATLTSPILGTPLEGKAKPAVWDPLIGVDWHRHVSRRWEVDANFQGGGFGVGTDVDVSAEGYANWHVARHVALRLGYMGVHYKMTLANVSIASFQRTLISRQTLHGPEFGVGIPF